MRKLLSLAFGWIFLACTVVAIVSFAIGDKSGSAAAGFVAVIFLVISAVIGPRDRPSQSTSAPPPSSDAAAQAKLQADKRRRQKRRREDEAMARFNADEQRRQNERDHTSW